MTPPTSSTFLQDWPLYTEELTKEDKVNFVIQVNGKLRDTISVSIDSPKDELEKLGLSSEKAKKFIDGKEIVKIIVVPNKLINIVVK